MHQLLFDGHHIAGVYVYREIKTGIIVYIGKDSKLKYKNRHLDHLNPNLKVKYTIDRVLQKNPDNYVYEQILFCDKIWLDNIEEILIRAYKPKYNITFK